MEVAVEPAGIGPAAAEVVEEDVVEEEVVKAEVVEEANIIPLAIDGGSEALEPIASHGAEEDGDHQIASMDASRPSEAMDEAAVQATPDNDADAQVNEELPLSLGPASSSMPEVASQVNEELPLSLGPASSSMPEVASQVNEELPLFLGPASSSMPECEAPPITAPLPSPPVAPEAPSLEEAPIVAVVAPGSDGGDLPQCETSPLRESEPQAAAAPELELGATQGYTEDDFLCGKAVADGSSIGQASDAQGVPVDVQDTQMYQDIPIISNLECKRPEELHASPDAAVTCPPAQDSLSSTQCYLDDFSVSMQQDVMATQQYADLGPAPPAQLSQGRSSSLVEAAESATQCYLEFGAEFMETQIPSSPGGVIVTSDVDVMASSSSTADPQVASTGAEAPGTEAASGSVSAAAPPASAGAAGTGEEPMTPMTQCYPLTQAYQSFQFSGPVHDVPDDGSSDEGGNDEGPRCLEVPHHTPKQPWKSASSVALGAAPKWRAQPPPPRLFTDMPPPPVPRQKPIKRAELGPATPSRGQPSSFSDAAGHSAEKRRRCSPVWIASDEAPWTPGRRLFGKQPVPASARRPVKRKATLPASKQDILPLPRPLGDRLDDAEDGEEDAVMWLGEADSSKLMTLIRGVC